jgi:hypothetical protein
MNEIAADTGRGSQQLLSRARLLDTVVKPAAMLGWLVSGRMRQNRGCPGS